MVTDPEPTPEQRAAWLRLSNAPEAPTQIGGSVEQDAALIAPLLPSKLTAPGSVLPTEPGVYESVATPGEPWVLTDDGAWWPPYQDYEAAGTQIVYRAAPFVRLVRTPTIGEMRRAIVNITHLRSFGLGRPMTEDQELKLATTLVGLLSKAGKL